MSVKQFFGAWLRLAFTGKLWLAERIEALGTALLGIIAVIWFRDTPMVATLMVAIPAAVLAGTIMVGLLLAPYWMRKEIEAEREALRERLEVRPALWVRRRGEARLTSPFQSNVPRRSAWYFDVSIANVSPMEPLGIRSILLHVTHGNVQKVLRPFVGTPTPNFGNVPTGTMEGALHLQPSESASGMLVFIEQHWGDEEKPSTLAGEWRTPTIILIDAQGHEHHFPAPVEATMWW